MLNCGGIFMTMGESRQRDPELHGVGGWLGFLCVSLLIFTPLSLLMQIVQTLLSIEQGGPPPEAVAELVLGVLITGFAVYAGIALVRLWRNAVRIAKWYFFVILGFVLLGGVGFLVEPQAAGPLESLSVARGLAGSVAWLAYLYRSERVRNTYGRNNVRDAAEVFR